MSETRENSPSGKDANSILADGGVGDDSKSLEITGVENDALTDGSEEPKVVYARGIAEGLILRLDGGCEPLRLQAALRDFMISRSDFLKGASVFADWFGEKPSKSLKADVVAILKKEFSVELEELPDRLRSKVEVSRSDSSGRKDSFGNKKGDGDRRGAREEGSFSRNSLLGDETEVEFRVDRTEGVGLSLFDGFGSTDEEGFEESSDGEFSEGVLAAGVTEKAQGVGDVGVGGVGVSDVGVGDVRLGAKVSGANPSRLAGGMQGVGDFDEESLADIPDARMVFGTLRSGQRVESEHSIIVAGDVNSGAELVAGGDIFVLGKLRGVAHAGAYDETGAGRVIFALELEPTQLRIGGVITRGGGESGSKGVSELARVDGDMIVVEPYQTRRASGGRVSSRRGKTRGFRMK
ncbi:hypothetical protein EBR25_12015 [bacterium]|nr:hypothetical protein [bacterium]